LGEEVKILFLEGLSFHFTMTFKDSPISNRDKGKGKEPVEYNRRIDNKTTQGKKYKI